MINTKKQLGFELGFFWVVVLVMFGGSSTSSWADFTLELPQGWEEDLSLEWEEVIAWEKEREGSFLQNLLSTPLSEWKNKSVLANYLVQVDIIQRKGIKVWGKEKWTTSVQQQDKLLEKELEKKLKEAYDYIDMLKKELALETLLGEEGAKIKDFQLQCGTSTVGKMLDMLKEKLQMCQKKALITLKEIRKGMHSFNEINAFYCNACHVLVESKVSYLNEIEKSINYAFDIEPKQQDPRKKALAEALFGSLEVDEYEDLAFDMDPLLDRVWSVLDRMALLMMFAYQQEQLGKIVELLEKKSMGDKLWFSLYLFKALTQYTQKIEKKQWSIPKKSKQVYYQLMTLLRLDQEHTLPLSPPLQVAFKAAHHYMKKQYERQFSFHLPVK